MIVARSPAFGGALGLAALGFLNVVDFVATGSLHAGHEVSGTALGPSFFFIECFSPVLEHTVVGFASV